MNILSDISEYVGIRIAMHDALQRYYASNGPALTDAKKVPLLQELIRESCRDNRLLGARNEVVGDAWAYFLGSREPAQILAFLADPEVIRYSTKAPQLKDKASTLNFKGAITLLFKSRNFAFEQIAQRIGLINYSAGETLSKHLQQAEQRIAAGSQIAPRPPESLAQAAAIRDAFDSPLGDVDPVDMGLPPASHVAFIDSRRAAQPRGR